VPTQNEEHPINGEINASSFVSQLTFTEWAAAQQPIALVPMTPFDDRQDSVLTQDLQYRVLQTTFVIFVPTGFVSDFASTPRALWSVIPPTRRYQLAAVVHDFLCIGTRVVRATRLTRSFGWQWPRATSSPSSAI
jgi:Protein of unknown function (DUF1353)